MQAGWIGENRCFESFWGGAQQGGVTGIGERARAMRCSVAFRAQPVGRSNIRVIPRCAIEFALDDP
jgi:hypothetical protein